MFTYGKAFYENCIKNLKKKDFDVRYCDDISSAKETILKMVTRYKSFGVPGSRTIRKLGILDELKNAGKKIFDHWDLSLNEEEVNMVRHKQVHQTDCFFSSANAITVSGEIINVDGIGNRIAGTILPNKKVIIVVGLNKIVPTLKDGLDRIKNYVAPIRAKEVGAKTPCTKTGVCTDCNTSDRICRITAIIHSKPLLTDVTIILVNCDLGI